MNKQIFNKLMKGRGLKQEPTEWKVFLEFCSMYLKDKRIKTPIVVELGVLNNRQKEFYEELLGATHIGIDISKDFSVPDILGDTHDSRTYSALKTKLKGKPINILFIDAAHGYEDVKKDFEMYISLCSHIVAIHDTETCRNTSRTMSEVWRFWDDLKGIKEYRDFSFISIFKRTTRGNQRGIGLIIKK